jgi:hypothetical protein
VQWPHFLYAAMGTVPSAEINREASCVFDIPASFPLAATPPSSTAETKHLDLWRAGLHVSCVVLG